MLKGHPCTESMKFAVDKIRAAENDNVMLTERRAACSLSGPRHLDYRGIPVMQQNKVLLFWTSPIRCSNPIKVVE